MPARVPLFPLATVLFPGTPLPLHIFESRYRRMLADCLTGDRRFGLVSVDADGDVPSAGAIGCTAGIQASQELPDGTSAIVVVGESRFVLAATLDEPTPYLVGLVEPFDDEPSAAPDPGRVQQLRQLFVHYLTGVRQLGDAPAGELHLPADAQRLSFDVAAATELDVRLKRRLLAERSTARRIDVLLSLLPALTAKVEHAVRIHQRARGNGHGPTPPNLVTE